MTTIISSLNRPRQIGLALTLIALAGCGGGGGSSTTTPSNTTTPSASIKITPMKGQFSAGTTVKVKRAKDSVEVSSCKVDATGSCSADIKTTETGPFLIEAGIAGDQYFDESTGALATVPASTTALRALIPNATTAVGVTALTEMAVGQIEAHTGGIAATKATDVIAANATIGSQFGVPDPLIAPAVIGASSAKLNGGNTADDYALKLAGIAKMTVTKGDAILALQDLRDDIKDGTLDGKKAGVVITTLNIPALTAGQTYQQAMNTALNAQVSAATAAYATTGAAVPTVTMTVTELSALLDAAMKVGAATQAASAGTTMTTATLNTQIANTVQTQVSTMAVPGANATTIAAATTAAVTAGTAAGTAMGSASTAANNFAAAAKTGTYVVNFQAPTNAAVTFLDWGMVAKEQFVQNAPGQVVLNETSNFFNYGTQSWELSIPATTGGRQWQLTPTSAGGWVDTTITALGMTSTADGTMTISNAAGNTFSVLIRETNLTNQPLNSCVGCPPAYASVVYPAGSIGYEFANQVQNNDVYTVDANQTVTDANGTPLNALPTIGTSNFCINRGGVAYWMTPIVGAAATAYNASWVTGGVCTTTAIATVQGPLVNPGQNTTVNISVKSTGNANAPSVLLMTVTPDPHGFDGLVFAAIPNKGVLAGWFTPQGPSAKTKMDINYNLTAATAMINAARAVTGVTGLGAAVPTLP